MTITTHDLPPINTPGLPTAEWELVDKTTAAFYLRRNKKNRRVRQAHLAGLVREHLAGRFIPTGEAIKFDTDGNLLDGQHRLRMVVEADLPAWLLVVRGLDPKVMDVIDTNAKRSAADVLGLHGFEYAALTASTARIGIAWDEGVVRFAMQSDVRTVSNSEVLAWVSANPSIVHDVTRASSWRSTIPARPTAIAIARHLTARVNGAESLCFFDDLAEYRTSGAGDPRHALLRRLGTARDNKERMSAIQELYLFIRTWNAVRTGDVLHKIPVGGATTPMPEPV